ncbi:MAG TPA: hypothetical protein VMZ29_13280 [Candidatus Bathyarchaeia archaeon]|nr:hypothetical protein [Candidatus Bathyarchaeia archaeon]
MVAEIQWMFITDKYSLVEIIDNAIVVARFNQNELMRDLIEARCVLLEAKSYEDLNPTLDKILKINESITDKRLFDLVSKLIDQINLYKDGQIKIDDRVDKVESKVSD